MRWALCATIAACSAEDPRAGQPNQTAAEVGRGGFAGGAAVAGAGAVAMAGPAGVGGAGGRSTGAAGTAVAADAGAPTSSASDAAPPAAGATPSAGTGGSLGAGAGGAGSGGAAAGAGGAASGGAGASGAGGPALPEAGARAADLESFAKDLQGLFIDARCDTGTPTPLAMMATCDHAGGMLRIEKQITFGGEAGKTYEVTLRVRGVWEPTLIQGGERPLNDQPFNVGGMVPPGRASSDPINYQQYSIKVTQPPQTYWLNDHAYVAHDIHKVDYEATIEIGGASSVVVSMNDGNERQIANWTRAFFEGLAPYDKMPSLGQTLHLDVISVAEKPEG
jgi:hypothetical protein